MIVAIDGNNWVSTLWYADANTALGMFNARLLAIEKEWSRITHKIVAFDSSTLWRKVVYSPYKAKRLSKPEELKDTLSEAKELVYNIGWNLIEVDGHEADDVLATVARIGLSRDIKVVLGTNDKDCIQCLVDKKVVILKSISLADGKMTPQWRNIASIPGEFGVRADQWVDYQTLVGDTTDSIPGLEGCGEKTAIKMLAARETLECLFEVPEVVGVPERFVAKLQAYRGESADLMKSLVTLRADLDLSDFFDLGSR